MEESDRREAEELVRQIMAGEFPTEADQDRAMAQLGRLLPDPNFSELIFWPSHHKLSSGIDESELTPQKIVQLASQYRPFEL